MSTIPGNMSRVAAAESAIDAEIHKLENLLNARRALKAAREALTNHEERYHRLRAGFEQAVQVAEQDVKAALAEHNAP